MLALLLAAALCADSTSLLADFDQTTDAYEAARLKISDLGSGIMHESDRLNQITNTAPQFDVLDANGKLAEANRLLTKASDDMQAGKDRMDLAMDRWNIGTMCEAHNFNAAIWYDAAAADFAAAKRWFASSKSFCDQGQGWLSCARGIIDKHWPPPTIWAWIWDMVW